jgi:hypothetical protein
MVASNKDLAADLGTSSVREKPHHERSTGSVETSKAQSADQTGPAVDSNEAPLLIAESSKQPLPLVTVSATSTANLSEDDPAIIHISEITMMKILGKRLSPSGVEYRCKLEPLWLAADLVQMAQMGGVHTWSYEGELVRAGRLRTLRTRKRKLSQI